MTMMRFAVVLFLLLGLTSVGALVPSASIVKESAVKSPLFRTLVAAAEAPPTQQRAHPQLTTLRRLKKHARHAAALAAAALVWNGAQVPEAHAKTTTRRQKAPPTTRMQKVKQSLAEYKQFAPAGGAVLVATGTGLVLGRRTVPVNNEDEEEEEKDKSKSRTANVVGEVSRIEKLNENKMKTQKILDRIAQLETDDIIDQYQLRATAQEETNKILERIRLEREQQDALLRAGESTVSAQEETQRIMERIRLERQQGSNILPPPRPTTPPPPPMTSYADQLPSNVQKGDGIESYTDRLSTNEIVNALIDQHAELAKSQMKAAEEAAEASSSSVAEAPVDAVSKAKSEDSSLASAKSEEPADDVVSKPPVASASSVPTVEVPEASEEETKVKEQKLDSTLEKVDGATEKTSADDDKTPVIKAGANIKIETATDNPDTPVEVADSEVKAGNIDSAKSDAFKGEPIDTADSSEEKDPPTKTVGEMKELMTNGKYNPVSDSSPKDVKTSDAPTDDSAVVEIAEVKSESTKESPEKNGKKDPAGTQAGTSPVPLEDIFPVKSSQIQLDETTIDSVRMKSAWSPKHDDKYASIHSLEDKAFTMLADLGMVELHPDPESNSYDNSKDDKLVE